MFGRKKKAAVPPTIRWHKPTVEEIDKCALKEIRRIYALGWRNGQECERHFCAADKVARDALENDSFTGEGFHVEQNAPSLVELAKAAMIETEIMFVTNGISPNVTVTNKLNALRERLGMEKLNRHTLMQNRDKMMKERMSAVRERLAADKRG